jgi:glycerophosphoryl diester phosphodiesterase
MIKRSDIYVLTAVLVSVLTLVLLAVIGRPADAQAPNAPSSTKPLLAGHRGTTKAADENTISAFAYALPYADILETDVRLTSDKKMVIMHDATLDRTTNCTGRVSERTLAYIKGCKTPRGHHPPSLRQLLVWADAQTKSAGLQLELKGTWTQAQVQGFVNEATRYDLEASASSFSKTNLDKVVRADDALPDEVAGRHLEIVFIEGGDPTMPPFLVCDSYDGYANSLAYLKKAYADTLQQVCNPPTYADVYGSLDTDPEYEQALATDAQILTVEDVKDARRWLGTR